MSPNDYLLLSSVVEPNARKIVSRVFGLESGAIPVLAAIAFKANEWGSAHPREIYDAKMGTETLIRHYISTLVKARLVVRTSGRSKRLCLTPEASRVVERYEREMRNACGEWGWVTATRVLTKPRRLAF
jgi:predicted transcriptional regulator